MHHGPTPPDAPSHRGWRTPSRKVAEAKRRRFAEAMRRAAERPRLTEAEYDAIIASDEWLQSQRDARAAWAEHERDMRLARNPSPMPPQAVTAPQTRTRERRDTGARQTAAASGDPDEPPPALAAALELAGRGPEEAGPPHCLLCTNPAAVEALFIPYDHGEQTRFYRLCEPCARRADTPARAEVLLEEAA